MNAPKTTDISGTLRRFTCADIGHIAVPSDRVMIELAAADEIERLRSDNADLKLSVVAFCAPWAVQYAQDHGLPAGHLNAVHYDLLAKCGARMDDFVRYEEPDNG